MNYAKEISIILPTYNERENIKKILKNLIKIGEKHFNRFEIIVIDDNSPDKTYEEAKKIKDKRIKVFIRKKEKGLASAIKFGIKKARYKYVCVMDADFQHPPKFIPKLYNELSKNNIDIVIASRFLKKSKIEEFSKLRKFLSKFAILIVSSFFPNLRKVKDPLSGFFILNKEKIKLENLNCIGFKFLFELLVRQKLNVREVSFTFKKRKFGASKLNMREVLNFFILFLILLKDTREYLRILNFLLVGFSGIFINQLAIFVLTEYLDIYYIISGIISAEISIIWNFILNELITFRDIPKNYHIKDFLSRLVKTNIIRLGGLSINIFMLFILTEFFSMHYLISNLIGICLAFMFNYTLTLKKVYE